ncbi:MAG: hypothetical protein Q8R92_07100 [Deltaproteobacteria bacterium]|nr:hypothetical protein [Deltaproteobacteria bacterium]
MNWKRIGFLAAVALLAVVVSPVGALAHDDYEDSLNTHPFKLAAIPVYAAGFVADQLVFRPFHWMLNNEPLETVTGHDEMSTRTPPDSLENMH